MAVYNFIQTRQGDLWSRKEAKWISPAVWQTWSQANVNLNCGYPTFDGCNRVANKLWQKYYGAGKTPKSWGAIKLNQNKDWSV